MTFVMKFDKLRSDKSHFLFKFENNFYSISGFHCQFKQAVFIMVIHFSPFLRNLPSASLVIN
jgi:hypothetical protein